MKKTLCVLLTLAVLMSACAPMAFAIKESSPTPGDVSGYLIFETDFEGQEVGGKPTGFDASLMTDLARMEIAADEKGNSVLKTYHGDPNIGDGKARAISSASFINFSRKRLTMSSLPWLPTDTNDEVVSRLQCSFIKNSLMATFRPRLT